MKAAKPKIGVLMPEAEGRRQKEGARRSIFTNMRGSQFRCQSHAADQKT
ncbi:hypothetical protein [Microcoleus vaginatus]